MGIKYYLRLCASITYSDELPNPPGKHPLPDISAHVLVTIAGSIQHNSIVYAEYAPIQAEKLICLWMLNRELETIVLHSINHNKQQRCVFFYYNYYPRINSAQYYHLLHARFTVT